MQATVHSSPDLYMRESRVSIKVLLISENVGFSGMRSGVSTSNKCRCASAFLSSEILTSLPFFIIFCYVLSAHPIFFIASYPSCDLITRVQTSVVIWWVQDIIRAISCYSKTKEFEITNMFGCWEREGNGNNQNMIYYYYFLGSVKQQFFTQMRQHEQTFGRRVLFCHV